MTPKQTFQQDKRRIAKHQDLVDREETRVGLLAAFNEYCWNLPGGMQTAQASWDANNRRQGAKEFIETFLSLADRLAPRAVDKSALEPEDAPFKPVQPNE